VALLVVGGLATVGGAWIAQRQARDLEAQIGADFKAGQAELESGRAQLRKANADHSTSELAGAKDHFKAAAAHFAAAPPRLHNSRLISLSELVPVARQYVDPRVKAVNEISAMGVQLAQAAQDGVDLNATFLQDSGGGGIAKLLPVLKLDGPTIDRLKQRLMTAQAAAAQIDLTTLTGAQRATVLTARATIDKGLTSIDDLVKLLPSAIEILGGNGPRTYLVEQMDPAELRGGGGFIGTYSILTADQGSLKLVRSGSINSIDNPRPNLGQSAYVAPPPALRELIGRSGWTLEDSNFFADFVANARAGETLLQHQIGVHVDGVIAIDPTTIADLLLVTGPVAVPGFGVTVQSDGFVANLFQLEESANRKANRKDFIAQVGNALFTKVSELSSTKLTDLVDTLNKAAQARHLQAYFNNVDAESQMDTYGWSGTVNPAKSSNFFLENEANLGATKANFYIQRSFELTTQRSASGIHVDVKVTLTDTTPIDFPGGSQYRGYVRFFVGSSATGLTTASLDAKNYQRTDIPAGTASKDGWFVVTVNPRTRSGVGSFTFSFDLPWSGASNNPQQLYLQKQPGTGVDGVKVTWNNDGQSYTTTGDLGGDRLIEFDPNAVKISVGQAASAHLPSLNL
jgi:hypothetical protein